jgi:hypothetical protein
MSALANQRLQAAMNARPRGTLAISLETDRERQPLPDPDPQSSAPPSDAFPTVVGGAISSAKNARPIEMATSWLKHYPETVTTVRGSTWTDHDTTKLIAVLNREGIEPGRDVGR